MSIAALLLFIRALSLTLPLWLVAGWSAAEAAIFFLVADIPISWIAVRSGTRAAILAAIVAALASAAGALAMWVWAQHDPSGAAATMAALPGIDGGLIGEAADRLHHGPHAVLAGSFTGIPFKLFALEAAREGNFTFLLLAPLLRLPRFLAVALLSGTVSRWLSRRTTGRQRLALLISLWTAFYAWYFSAMPR
ncbi:MAG: hypothetical protein H0W65_01300 [Sphingomonas sp.]|uniref:hypothetical protein n=1 Tax=Sphingomonas sp. TaxID=28214 RepID=UPI001847427B|nr:hypothetical protein [Sphingomonas sp.]MBA3666345.1 hypothetical protein [Sphingomonas sp.]